jgi:serine/threonine-protein kinase RsbW
MTGGCEGTRSLVTVSDPASLDRVHGLLEQLWQDLPSVHADDRAALETALAELVANAVEHASPASPVPLDITVDAYPDRLEARLRDSGVVLPRAALDVLEAPEPPEVDPLAESGRGLLLVRLTMDDVRYSREGGRNVWRLVRTRR